MSGCLMVEGMARSTKLGDGAQRVTFEGEDEQLTIRGLFVIAVCISCRNLGWPSYGAFLPQFAFQADPGNRELPVCTGEVQARRRAEPQPFPRLAQCFCSDSLACVAAFGRRSRVAASSRSSSR